MRSLLVLGLLATLTVVDAESLSCQQCYSTSSDCFSKLFECTEGNPVSCGASSASWPEDGKLKSYHENFCSELPAEKSFSFAVRLTGQQPFLFANEQCEGGEKCVPTPPENFPENGTGDTQCPTCIASDQNSCEETNQTCNEEELCVNLDAEIDTDDTEEGKYKLFLKGCSNIKQQDCDFLSPGTGTLGSITLLSFKCSEPNIITTANSSTTTNSSTTPMPTTTSSSGRGPAATLPWAGIAGLGLGLLLLF